MPIFYTFKLFAKCPALVHAVSTKSCDLPYAFSLALHTGENAEDIIANRKELASFIQSDTPLYFIGANQTHSDHIEIITEKKAKGWESLEDAIEDCDSLVTNQKGAILTILTADCVPLLLYDKQKEVVAAIHAGWKGTKAQIVKKTIKKMKEVFGCMPEDIMVGIAPSIGRCCYEVGEDVAKYFMDMPEAIEKRRKKYMLDLPLINKKQLLDAGIKEENIETSGICTSCNVKRFFSYRKEQGCSGRFMSMIGLV